ncbi:hypothetical protein ACFL4L_07230 [bacterium]
MDFISKNLLELAAIIISIVSLIFSFIRFKATQPTVILEEVFEASQHIKKLKITPATSSEQLNIIGSPRLFKKGRLFYLKEIDHEVAIQRRRDPNTKEPMNNIQYIGLNTFSDLEKGKYKLRMKIDRPPYRLKYKFRLPL